MRDRAADDDDRRARVERGAGRDDALLIGDRPPGGPDAGDDEEAVRPRRLRRGDLLARLGRTTEARAEFERAAALTRNERERELLLERARGCGS